MNKLASMVGIWMFSDVTYPAIIGGIACASENTDCWIPKISPWDFLSDKFDISAEKLGWSIPFDIEIKGIIIYK